MYTTDGLNFVSVGGSSPSFPDYLEVYGNRLHAAGKDIASTYGPSTDFYSARADGTNWTVNTNSPDTAGFTYVDVGFNGQIVGIKKTANILSIFKDEAQYTWDGTTLLYISPTTATSNTSLAGYNNFWFWLNYDGIWSFAGTEPQLLSVPLNDIIPSITGTDLFNAPGYTFDRHYYLSIGTVTLDDVTVTNGVLDMDFDKSQWFIHDYANKPTAWAKYYDTGNEPRFIFGDTLGNVFTNLVGNTDNGIPIQMLLRTRKMDEGQPEIDKKYNKIYVEATPYGSLVIQYSINGGNWQTIGDLYSTLTKHYFSPLVSGSYSKNIQFQIIDNSDQRPELRKLFYYVVGGGGTK
jgi:hypothetical protein